MFESCSSGYREQRAAIEETRKSQRNQGETKSRFLKIVNNSFDDVINQHTPLCVCVCVCVSGEINYAVIVRKEKKKKNKKTEENLP